MASACEAHGQGAVSLECFFSECERSLIASPTHFAHDDPSVISIRSSHHNAFKEGMLEHDSTEHPMLLRELQKFGHMAKSTTRQYRASHAFEGAAEALIVCLKAPHDSAEHAVFALDREKRRL